jgi:hypothetical protein
VFVGEKVMKWMMYGAVMMCVMAFGACTKDDATRDAAKQVGRITLGEGLLKLSEQKRFTIAKHYITKDPIQRWVGFQLLMDLAVKDFAPAKEYYLSIRQDVPVLPGESEASFALYADYVKGMLVLARQKMEAETGEKCTKVQDFALLNTVRADADGLEQWTFDYCNARVNVPVRVKLNQVTGHNELFVQKEDITLE